ATAGPRPGRCFHIPHPATEGPARRADSARPIPGRAGQPETAGRVAGTAERPHRRNAEELGGTQVASVLASSSGWWCPVSPARGDSGSAFAGRHYYPTLLRRDKGRISRIKPRSRTSVPRAARRRKNGYPVGDRVRLRAAVRILLSLGPRSPLAEREG